MQEVLRKTARKWQLVMYLTFVAGACSFFVSTLITPKYSSEITILIVQKDANASSASQSVEYLSEVFSQVVHTELFLDDVLGSKYDIAGSFSPDPAKRKQQWRDDVKVKKNSEAGILKISSRSRSKGQSFLIAQAIAENFAVNSEKYHGSSDAVITKLIDGPIIGSSPAVPNIPLNTGFGLLVGFLGSLIVVTFFDKFDLRVIGKEKRYDRMVSEQIAKQLKKREEKRELSYEEEQKPKNERRTMLERSEEKERSSAVGEFLPKAFEDGQSGPAKESKARPDLEGSMIDADEFKRGLKAPIAKKAVARDGEKSGPKHSGAERASQTTTETAQEREIAQPSSNNLLSKLYGKSLFADRKFEQLQAERSGHQRQVNGNQLPIIESVRKITPANNSSAVPASSAGKAAAPENLPIFLDEQKEAVAGKKLQQKEEKQPVSTEDGKDNAVEREAIVGMQRNYKEFEPIEHIAGPDEQPEKEQLDPNGTESRKIGNDEQELPSVEHVVGYREEELDDSEREPSEEEVKERLNKLLKGEL